MPQAPRAVCPWQSEYLCRLRYRESHRHGPFSAYVFLSVNAIKAVIFVFFITNPARICCNPFGRYKKWENNFMNMDEPKKLLGNQFYPTSLQEAERVNEILLAAGMNPEE